MSRHGDSVGRRPRRVLSGEERALWSSATREVAPLRGVTRAGDEMPARQTASADPAPVAKKVAAAKREPGVEPEPVALDRRLKQRVARGRVEIDARIDLHGCTQAQAHDALARFLREVSISGARVVLVITGKGGDAGDGERDVLRRQVPYWLKSKALRAFVVGFTPAHIAHGGDGALYVKLRGTRRRS